MLQVRNRDKLRPFEMTYNKQFLSSLNAHSQLTIKSEKVRRESIVPAPKDRSDKAKTPIGSL